MVSPESSAEADATRASPIVASPIHLVGCGALGGKAQGLSAIHATLCEAFPDGRFPGFTVGIPRMTVLTSDFFDAFMTLNGLWEVAVADLPDDRLAHAFQQGALPGAFVGDLWRLASETTVPLALRSSSLLEDAMFRPFAGVYGTKMIPNRRPDVEGRFRELAEGVKFVIASTFFRDARRYRQSIGQEVLSEKMSVIVQEVVGERHGDRFYPSVSGVARSWNFYPVSGAAPEDGVVDLALGLGKTIVDGGKAWSFSPARPDAPPPYNGVADMLRNTQTSFWAVHMGPPPPHDPIQEDEHLVRANLSQAEYDDTLRFVASTYDQASDRIIPTVLMKGPRLLNFAPMLQLEKVPLIPLLREILRVCKEVVGAEVEVEFAMVLHRHDGLPARLGFLQVRPMVVSTNPIDVSEDLLQSPDVAISSNCALGNGVIEGVRDIVYVAAETFDPSRTREIATELEGLNAWLVAEGRPYVLIGFGRWGTSDPWYGIPCVWSQIAGAKVIVEASWPGMETDMSQGSHFFHNVTSFGVAYFSIRKDDRLDWDWIERQPEVARTCHVRLVQSTEAFEIRVDGRNGRGVVVHHG
jgi:hypothetical protein